MSALDNWTEEKRSAHLYRVVSEAERDTPRQALFRELAQAAETQAGHWEAVIAKAGGAPPSDYRPDIRTRLVAALVPVLGPRILRGVLAAMKVRGMAVYSKAGPGHPMPVRLADVGRRHRGVGSGTGGTLRAAVFGINDGLVSNASLIMGVAGAAAGHSVILLSGIAGLLAGAFSMAAGEYISMRSQREMFEYQIGLEKEELDQYPQEEAAELALIFAAKGLAKDEARRLAGTLVADPERALDTLAREELGLNPDELGSPWGAAWSSFFSFALGGVIPLLPFLLGGGANSLPAAVVLTGLALFAVGAVLSLFSGRHALLGGFRMLAVGFAAGAATYFIGGALSTRLG